MQATNNKQVPDAINDISPDVAGADNTPSTATQHWLSIQCTMLQGVSCGLLFCVSADGKNARIDASWPRLVAARVGLNRKVLIAADRNKSYLEELEGEAGAPPTLRLYQPVSASGNVCR